MLSHWNTWLYLLFDGEIEPLDDQLEVVLDLPITNAFFRRKTFPPLEKIQEDGTETNETKLSVLFSVLPQEDRARPMLDWLHGNIAKTEYKMYARFSYVYKQFTTDVFYHGVNFVFTDESEAMLFRLRFFEPATSIAI